MCVHISLSCVSWPDRLAWKPSQAGDLFVWIWLFTSSVGGSQITTHVVLSVTASRLQGNSLSSSRRPSICCCPFVSSSIHRSEKDSRLWRFLFLVFSPYVWPCEAWLSRHMSTCSLLLSAHLRIVVMIRMDASTHVPRWGKGPAGGELMPLLLNKVVNDDTGVLSKGVLNLVEFHLNEIQVSDSEREGLYDDSAFCHSG